MSLYSRPYAVALVLAAARLYLRTRQMQQKIVELKEVNRARQQQKAERFWAAL